MNFPALGGGVSWFGSYTDHCRLPQRGAAQEVENLSVIIKSSLTSSILRRFNLLVFYLHAECQSTAGEHFQDFRQLIFSNPKLSNKLDFCARD